MTNRHHHVITSYRCRYLLCVVCLTLGCCRSGGLPEGDATARDGRAESKVVSEVRKLGKPELLSLVENDVDRPARLITLTASKDWGSALLLDRWIHNGTLKCEVTQIGMSDSRYGDPGIGRRYYESAEPWSIAAYTALREEFLSFGSTVPNGARAMKHKTDAWYRLQVLPEADLVLAQEEVIEPSDVMLLIEHTMRIEAEDNQRPRIEGMQGMRSLWPAAGTPQGDLAWRDFKLWLFDEGNAAMERP